MGLVEKEKELVERIGKLSIGSLHVALFSIKDIAVLEPAVKAGEDHMAWLLADKKTRAKSKKVKQI